MVSKIDVNKVYARQIAVGEQTNKKLKLLQKYSVITNREEKKIIENSISDFLEALGFNEKIPGD